MSLDYGLSGKRVLVTGASRGLGESCARALADHGARVLLVGRDEPRLVQIVKELARPNDHQSVVADLTTFAGIDSLIEALKDFGALDVIIHAMGGGLGMREPLLPWEQFEMLFRTNLGAQAELNRRILPSMVERKTGNIIMVGSLASAEAVGSVGYNTVKAALAGYTRSLGRALADSGVIVTGVMPGAFVAPENAWVRLEKRDPELVKKIVIERQPRKRLGDVAELLPFILFLCSSQAGMFAGCMVPVDAGEGLGYTV